MPNKQNELIVAEIAALKRAVMALALSSQNPENFLAELERQKEIEMTALLHSNTSDKYSELVGKNIQLIYDTLAHQL